MDNPEDKKIPSNLKGVTRILRAFTFSWSGFKYMMAEAAFRQEAALAAAGGVALFFIDAPIPMRLAMLAALLLILIVETLNTGLEKLVDLVTSEYHEKAKMAKDMGSLAVLLSFIVAALVWAAGIHMAIERNGERTETMEVDG